MYQKPTRFVLLSAVAMIVVVALTVSAAGETPAQPPCWRVSAGDGQAFLLAGLHVGRESDFPMLETIEEAFAAADRLLVEIDPAEAQTPDFQEKVASLAPLPPGRTLRDEFTAEEYAELETMFGELGMPTMMFEKMNPGIVYLFVQQLLLTRIGQDPMAGAETYFTDKARKAGKSILQAETVESQMDLFMGKNGRLLLLETAREVDGYEERIEELMTAWRTGDLETIEKLIFDPGEMKRPEIRKLLKAIFTDRNKAMSRKITAELAKGGTCFVLLGAGHFAGDNGIPALLKKRPGLEIDRVRFGSAD